MPAAIDPRQLARMPASDASMRRFIDAAEVGASMQTGYRYAVLRFVDHGPGVPPESRSKIFERFYTADPSRAREKGGTGLAWPSRNPWSKHITALSAPPAPMGEA